MKIEFQETEYETSFTLLPETPNEVAMLYRMTVNSKAKKPILSLSLGSKNDSQIYGMVSIEKFNKNSNRTKTFISNRKYS